MKKGTRITKGPENMCYGNGLFSLQKRRLRGDPMALMSWASVFVAMQKEMVLI